MMKRKIGADEILKDSRRVIFDNSSSSSSPTSGNVLVLVGGNQSDFRVEGGGARSVVLLEENRFGSSDYDSFIIDEDYYYYDDKNLQEKKRRLTSDQVQTLETCFEAENKLEPEKKRELAKKLGLQPRQVAIWFQNRRARYKNKQLERDFDLLKSSYDSLLADHDSLLNENLRLRSQIVSLTEKLRAKDATEESKLEGEESAKVEQTSTELPEEVGSNAEGSRVYYLRGVTGEEEHHLHEDQELLWSGLHYWEWN